MRPAGVALRASSGAMPQVEYATYSGRRRTLLQQNSSVRQDIHHPWVKQDFAASSADIGGDGYQCHIIAFSDALFNLTIVFKTTIASGTRLRTLRCHDFTRTLKLVVHLSGSGR